ncbi:hypothetical protein RJT34_17683 [Clitoria ternatea]|uniref:Uncharacterized protein n=1 Tax=Clitoria ternatea TaxID=43366 RepID=A0AAN9J9S9_CLITE
MFPPKSCQFTHRCMNIGASMQRSISPQSFLEAKLTAVLIQDQQHASAVSNQTYNLSILYIGVVVVIFFLIYQFCNAVMLWFSENCHIAPSICVQ